MILLTGKGTLGIGHHYHFNDSSINKKKPIRSFRRRSHHLPLPFVESRRHSNSDYRVCREVGFCSRMNSSCNPHTNHTWHLHTNQCSQGHYCRESHHCHCLVLVRSCFHESRRLLIFLPVSASHKGILLSRHIHQCLIDVVLVGCAEVLLSRSFADVGSPLHPILTHGKIQYERLQVTVFKREGS